MKHTYLLNQLETSYTDSTFILYNNALIELFDTKEPTGAKDIYLYNVDEIETLRTNYDIDYIMNHLCSKIIVENSGAYYDDIRRCETIPVYYVKCRIKERVASLRDCDTSQLESQSFIYLQIELTHDYIIDLYETYLI